MALAVPPGTLVVSGTPLPIEFAVCRRAGERRGGGGLALAALLLLLQQAAQVGVGAGEHRLALAQQLLHAGLLARAGGDLRGGLLPVVHQLLPEGREVGLVPPQAADHVGVLTADLVEQVLLVGGLGDAAGLEEHLDEARLRGGVEAAQALGQQVAAAADVLGRLARLDGVLVDAVLDEPEGVLGAVVGLGRRLHLGVQLVHLRLDLLQLGPLGADGGGRAGRPLGRRRQEDGGDGERHRHGDDGGGER